MTCQWCDKPVEDGSPGIMDGVMHRECREKFDAEQDHAWKTWHSLNPPDTRPAGMTIHEWMADLKARWSLPR